MSLLREPRKPEKLLCMGHVYHVSVQGHPVIIVTSSNIDKELSAPPKYTPAPYNEDADAVLSEGKVSQIRV